jgi:hypothetical protein
MPGLYKNTAMSEMTAKVEITPEQFAAHANEFLAQAREKKHINMGLISDGYHTFDELYSHRVQLFIALCKHLDYSGREWPWRSKLHSDGSSFEGWFVLGLYKKPGEQITYHLPMSKWDECRFAETLERAPEWDGHTSADVLERLKTL